MAGVKLTIDQRALQAVVSALKAEEDGKQLRTDLNRNLKTVLLPAKQAAATAIQSMPTKGESDGSMRSAMASALAIQVRATGKQTGVALSAAQGKYPRGFKNAPRRFNADGFRRRVFGGDTWTTQVGQPGWFDDATKAHKAEYVEGVQEAIVAMAGRIIARTDARGAF